MIRRTAPSTYFLQNKVNFLAMLGVVATTVFSWFNVNSWFIILIVLCRLVDGGPVKAIKAAFSNIYFLGFLAMFLCTAGGFLHTHNLAVQGHSLEKMMTILAISFVIAGGQFTDEQGYSTFMTAYCTVLLAACTVCIVIALYHFTKTGKPSFFFYHTLTKPLGQNAVFFTVYIIFGLLFLVNHRMDLGTLYQSKTNLIQGILITLFTVFIILLSSKLFLVLLFLLLLTIAVNRFYARKDYKTLTLMMSFILLGGILLVYTDNPIKRRFLDLGSSPIDMAQQKKFTPSTQFNGATIRIFQWRLALQILNENKAWLFGVSPGDSQDLLNEKYVEAQVDTGIPHTSQKGFLDYNFHNQYIETTVQSGILGLAILLFVCGLLIYLVIVWRTLDSFFTVLALLSIFTVESFLTMQHGIFAFVFMPMMLLYSPRHKKDATIV